MISLGETTSVPATLTFSAGADDPDGTIRRLDWDFGDGVDAQTDGGTRVVGVPGRDTATVRAADDSGNPVSRTLAWSVTVPGWPSLSPAAEPPSTTASPAPSLSGAASGPVSRVVLSTDRGESAVAAGTPALAASAPTVEQNDPLIVRFAVTGSAATHPHLPDETLPVKGLAHADGLSVDGLFTPDGWATVYRRPAFILEGTTQALKDGEERVHPEGTVSWAVRIALPSAGSRRYRIEAREARGAARSAEGSSTVTEATGPLNHGPVRVAPRDGRYFEHAGGIPFAGTGHDTGTSPELLSYDLEDQLAAMGSGNRDLLRRGIGGTVWGSAWSAWRSRTLGFEGYPPATGLSLRSVHGDGIAVIRLDAQNPLLFNGWNTGPVPPVPGRTYRIRVRWRTEGNALKLVISEMGDWLLNRIGPDGLPDPTASSLFDAGGSVNQKLHEFYWRFLSARSGAFRSVHSWGMVNEQEPAFGNGFVLTDLLARQGAADGNPRLASASTCATLAADAWTDPRASAISYTDFHACARSTGWLGPKDELANDSKGVWLHEMVWARTGPAAVAPPRWHGTSILDRNLHHLSGSWRRFMGGTPLTNGRYVDAASRTSTATLRAFGQKDLAAGAAHLWIDNPQHTWRRVVGGWPRQPPAGR